MILGILAILFLLLLLCAVAQVFLYLMGLLAVVVVLRLTYNACRWAVRRHKLTSGVRPAVSQRR